ncbi:MAG TPA: UMP kinase [Candidatus Paceibacterota bacterium]
MGETFVISLGGSLIVPEEIDTDFLKEFKTLILSQVQKGKKFIIITGGGKTCRKYNKAAMEIVDASKEDLDWIGLTVCNVNAQLLRVVFREDACKKVFYDVREEGLKDSILQYPIVIGGTLEPGHSSDYDAVLAAKNINAKKIINLSNTDYVYDSDPRINPQAKKIEEISWSDYRNIIPKEWTHAGLNSPFDPVASQIAQEAGIEVIIMNGKPIENLANVLEGKGFAGTRIY